MSASSSLSAIQAATAAALVVSSLAVGYAIGVKSATTSSSPTNSSPAEPETSKQQEAVEKPTQHDNNDSEMEEEDLGDRDLSAVKAGDFEPCKLVLVVRTDLKMTPGKIAAQCGHATLACYKALQKTNPQLLRHWERTGQAKIALKGSSEDELLELERIAKSLNLCARSILDAGRTQIAAGSRTVLGIGPAPLKLVDKVTGKLKLL